MSRPVRVLGAVALLATSIGLAPAAHATAYQKVEGTVLHPATTGAVARDLWVNSGGQVNDVSGHVFEVDPATVGKRFKMSTPGAINDEWTNLDVTFYDSYDATGAVACAVYDFNNPVEAGRVCGVLGVVWSFTGVPASFTYEAGDGVTYADTFTKSGPIDHVGRVDFTTGTDLAFEDHYAYVGSEDPSPLEGGLHIIDIANPRAPVEVGHFPCSAQQDDVAVWHGIVVQAIDSPDTNTNPDCAGTGEEGVRVIDARVPSAPAQIAFFNDVSGDETAPLGAHTITKVADTGYVYLSNYYAISGQTASVDVLDLNPVLSGGDPVIVGTIDNVGIPRDGCHDITINDAGTRAYCAAITHTEIWDITDPVHPTSVAIIATPLINIHHSTAVQGNILVIGDEFTGAEAAFGCQLGEKGPFGRISFFDISDETLPKYLGSYQVPEQHDGVRYTAHNFNIIPGTSYLVAAWYKAGTRVIDFSDPTKPVEVAHVMGDGSVTWSAYWYKNAIFTGDLHRGMDVFTLTGLPGVPVPPA